MRAFESGIDRGFERLSDRSGGVSVQATRLIAWYVETNTAPQNSAGFNRQLPAGTKRVEVVANGGGGTASQSYAGTGGGSVEFHFTPSSDGLFISGVIALASGYNAGNPSNTTVNLPDGLGQIVAYGGFLQNNAGSIAGGSGSGPAGSIVRNGGLWGSAGQGPFGGGLVQQANRGGNGAGPYGGVGAIDEYPEMGGGSGINRLNYISGFVSIKCFGEPL